MEIINKHRFKIFLSIFILFFGSMQAKKPPKITVILVIDQFAHHYLEHVRLYLKGGLKLLFNQGIYFTNAYFPHAMPATATGHTGLNTGTYAKYHGIIGNGWLKPDGMRTESDQDTVLNAAVFAPEGLYDYGKSAYNIQVDGISDQFMLYPRANTPHHVYALSMKSRSAICTANKLGKAVWFDEKSGLFTSSKAYFNELPDWLMQFNKKNKPIPEKIPAWQPIYSRQYKAYASHNPNTYKYTRTQKGLLNQPLTSDNPDNPYYAYLRSPYANKLLLDLAQEVIDTHVSKRKNDEMILWLCISGLDQLGHIYGPNAIESLDMIYQLDRHLYKFMRHVQKQVGKKEALFLLTADHGISPIIEVLQEKGMTTAHRIDSKKLIDDINNLINTRHGIGNLVAYYKCPQFYFDHNKLKSINKNKQTEIFHDIKKFFLEQKGIKQVWTYDELMNTYFEPNQIEDYYKKQLFPNRSGDIIVQTMPYTIITKWAQGTSHKSPYETDTHVPLVLYQPDMFERTVVRDKVWTLQIANTLAEILNIPKPSASTFGLLPHVFDEPPGF